MAALRFKLGRRLARPPEFTPTRAITRGALTYQLDLTHRICRLVRDSDGTREGVYYQLILPESSAPVRGGLWAGLRRGIVIPSLVGAMLVGAFLVLYPLYPGVKFQVQRKLGGFSQTASAEPGVSATNRLIIPKIGVDTNILEGSSLAVLNHHDGVWHQLGAITGDNFVLSGHRFKYLPPNTSTLYNLGQLQVGDAILVDWEGKRYVYSVSATELIRQSDTSILAPSPTTELTIYTCYDLRQTERTVVIAKLAP